MKQKAEFFSLGPFIWLPPEKCCPHFESFVFKRPDPENLLQVCHVACLWIPDLVKLTNRIKLHLGSYYKSMVFFMYLFPPVDFEM